MATGNVSAITTRKAVLRICVLRSVSAAERRAVSAASVGNSAVPIAVPMMVSGTCIRNQP